MQYFTNSELADKYHVSERTVRLWITRAKRGELDLTLHTANSKTYVANNTGNIETIERFVEFGKTRRNRKAYKTLEPRPEFYNLYTQAQIYDIVRNLEIYREIPRDYNYFDGGASNWNDYALRMAKESAPNNLTMTLKLLAEQEKSLDARLERFDRVNVVDIGVGNAYPVKPLLSHLLKLGKLGRYVAIDISPEMLLIARRNIKEWFGSSVSFEGLELDITRDRFATMLAEGYISKSDTKTGNLVLFLGGTIQNFRKRDAPLQAIADSMGIDDLLVHSQRLDTPASRHFFDFNLESSSSMLAPNHRFIFDLLNIDESFYDVEMGFNEKLRERYIRVRMKMAVQIDFEFDEGHRCVDLNRGESILLWRASQDSALDVVNQLERNDFYVLQTSQTDDREYMLTVSQIQRES